MCNCLRRPVPEVHFACCWDVKGRYGSGNKGNFESGQNRSKAYSSILEDRECNPLFVPMDTSCKLYFKRDNILQLRTSNSLVNYQLRYPPLSHKEDCLLVGCLTSQQQASVSQGRICSDNFTCSHTEIEAADQTFYLTQSQYTDTGPTSPSADPITPGAWQGSHWSANF